MYRDESGGTDCGMVVIPWVNDRLCFCSGCPDTILRPGIYSQEELEAEIARARLECPGLLLTIPESEREGE